MHRLCLSCRIQRQRTLCTTREEHPEVGIKPRSQSSPTDEPGSYTTLVTNRMLKTKGFGENKLHRLFSLGLRASLLLTGTLSPLPLAHLIIHIRSSSSKHKAQWGHNNTNNKSDGWYSDISTATSSTEVCARNNKYTKCLGELVKKFCPGSSGLYKAHRGIPMVHPSSKSKHDHTQPHHLTSR